MPIYIKHAPAIGSVVGGALGFGTIIIPGATIVGGGLGYALGKEWQDDYKQKYLENHGKQ